MLQDKVETEMDPLLNCIQSTIQTWKSIPHSNNIGSVKAVDNYIQLVSNLIQSVQPPATKTFNEVVKEMLQSKLKLNQTCSRRGLNRFLVESMIVAEILTHETIDYFMSHPDFNDETPRPDFRFDWVHVLNIDTENTSPIYLTDYGVEDMLRSMVK